MIKIHEGYIIKPRKIMKSDIWQKKPAWWLKVWDYLIIKVNHKDNEYFPRGTNFFTYEMIHHDCKLSNDRVKKHSLDNLVRWLKHVRNITTQKTTRGFIVTICNYETYQNPNNYKNDTANDSQNETQTKHKRNTNDTINKNVRMKEGKKVKPLVPEHLELAELLKKKILDNLPNAKITETQINQWTDTVGLMIVYDKRTLVEIKELIIWAQEDSFWFKNILSMTKLRKQFDKLTANIKENRDGKNRQSNIKLDEDAGKYANIGEKV